MKILSLFDGMACGMLAMLDAGVEVESYDAYEIDKYAVKNATHNFPTIREHGDVFAADFTQYEGVDWLVGGSPCTYWSIAQTRSRETEASGLGWELFSQYVRALHEAKPKFFIYENNKSMSKAIRDQIRATFGFEEICINSALVSAQNRQRYYWVGKRNVDGTYSKVDVKQPEDRGILLKDVLDGVGCRELTEREMEYMVRETHDGRNHFDFGYIQDGTRDKSKCVTANISKGVPYNVCCVTVRIGTYPGSKCPECDSKQYRVYDPDGKAVTQCGQGGGLGAKTGLYAVPLDWQLAELSEEYWHGDKTGDVFGKIVCRNTSDNNGQPAQCTRVYRTSCKAKCLDGDSRHYIVYALATEFDSLGAPTKAISGADGKTYTVYPVRDGQITIMVRAVSADPELSGDSNIVKRTCDLEMPSTIGNFATGEAPRMKWDEVPGAVKYEVWCSVDSDDNYKLLLSTSGTKLTHRSAKPGHIYIYKIRAIAHKSAANSAFTFPVGTRV